MTLKRRKRRSYIQVLRQQVRPLTLVSDSVFASVEHREIRLSQVAVELAYEVFHKRRVRKWHVLVIMVRQVGPVRLLFYVKTRDNGNALRPLHYTGKLTGT